MPEGTCTPSNSSAFQSQILLRNFGLYGDNGKEFGNYYLGFGDIGNIRVILGLHWDNEKNKGKLLLRV